MNAFTTTVHAMRSLPILRILAGFGIFLLALLVGGWLAFVPWAKEPAYEFVMSWGAKGDAPGQFKDPTGIAVWGGEVFVSDARNGRIQVFDFDGNFKRRIGTPGKAPGQLGRPMNLAIAGGELYVADYWNDRIAVFGLDGTYRRAIGGKGDGPGRFSAPGGVAVAANGDIYVADFYNQRIQQLRADGEFVRQWGTTRQVGVWAGEFNYPTAVAVAADGTLVVADGYNDRIQLFDANGAFVRKWGGPFGMNIFGPFNGWFATVTSVVVDRGGRIYVADFYNNRIQMFTADGTFLSAFGGKGDGPGRFKKAIGVAVAEDGTVFATDFGNNRVQKWRPPAVNATGK